MAKEITNTLHFAAKQCGLKRKLNKNPGNQFTKNKPWFDNHCASIKTKIRSMAKIVKMNPHVPNYRK